MATSTIFGIAIAAVIIGGVLYGLIFLSARALSRTRAPAAVESMPVILPDVASLNSAVVIARKGGRVEYANDHARQLFGLNGETPNLHRMARMAQPQEAFLELFATEGQTSVTIGNRSLEATSVFIPGDPQQFVITLREGGQLTGLRGDNRSAEAVGALVEVGRALSSSLNLDITLNAVLQTVGRIVRYDIGEINLWDSDSQVLWPRAHAGDRTYIIALERRVQSYQIGEGLTGWIARNKRPLLINDLEHHAEAQPKIDRIDFPFRSVVGVPLLFGKDSELIGTVELASFEREAYSDRDVTLLETVAGQAAIAIRNAQLYAQQESRIAELSALARVAQTAATLAEPRELYASLVDSIAKLAGVQLCGFLLFDEGERALVSQPPFRGVPEALRERYRIPVLPDNKSARLWREGDHWRTDDMRADPLIEELGLKEQAETIGMTASLMVPLIVGGNRVGVLQVANKLNKTLFNDEDARLLRTLAGQAAVLIDNARLVREAEDRVRHAEVMRQIAEITGSALSLEQIYQGVMERTARLIQAELGVVLLLDEAKGELAPQRGSELGGGVGEAEFATLRSDDPDFKLSSTATRKPFYSWRASHDRRITKLHRRIVEHYQIETVITAPLIVQDRSIGEMWLGSRYERRFSRSDVQLVATVAAQLASAIERTRLASATDETLRHRVEQLTALTRVGRELNQTLELDHILKLVYNEAVRATRADCGSIVLLNLESTIPAARLRIGDHNSNLALDSIEFDVALSGNTHLIADLAAPDALAAIPPEHYAPLAAPGHAGIRSLLVTPISYEGSIVGVVELHSRRANGFDRAMLDFSQAVAAQAAIAVGNAQRYEEQKRRGELLRRRADQLSQLLQISRSVRSDRLLAVNLEAIAYGVQEAVGFNVVLISEYDSDTGLLHRTAAAGLPIAEFNRLQQTPARLDDIRAALQREFRISQSYYVPHTRAPKELMQLDAVIIPQAEEPTASNKWHQDDFLFVPLIGSGGQTVGMMSVDDPRSGLAPDLAIIETLEIFANQAALAIENARLFIAAESRAAELSKSLDDLQKSYRDLDLVSRTLSRKEQELRDLIEQTELRARRLLGLHRIASTTAEARAENALLHRAARSTVVEISVDACVVALLKDGQILQVTAQASVTNPGIDLNPLLAERNPLSHIIEIHSPILARDLHGWSDSKLVQSLQIRSFVGVPIFMAQQLSGALLVGSQKEPTPFSTEDIDLLTILSGQIGASLENIRLYTEIQQRLADNTRLFNATRELQEFSASVFESLQQGLVVLDTEGKVLSINGWMRERFGWADSLVGQNLFEFRSYYRDVGLADSVIQAVVYDRPVERFGVRDSAPDGSLIVSNFYGYPLRRDGKVTGVVLLVDDVTERAHLEADVRERATQLQALTEASRVMSSALREENVIALVLDQVGRVVPYDSATLWLLHEENFLRVASARGFENDAEQLGLIVQVEDSALFKEMTATGHPILVPDVRNDPRFPAGMISRTRSWLGGPLISKGKVMGLLALDKVEANFYTANHADLVIAFANQVAVALDNAQLFEQSVQRAMQLNERTQRLVLLNRVSGELSGTLDLNRILDISVREMSSAMGGAHTTATLYDGESASAAHGMTERLQEPAPADLLGPITQDESVTQRLRETMAPIVIDDVALSESLQPAARLQLVNRGAKTMLVVPLTAGGSLLGSLAIERKADGPRFRLGEIEVAQTIANQTAVAVQNARLYEETQRLLTETRQRNAELAALFDLGVSASQVLEESRLIDVTLDNVRKLLGADSVALVQVTEANEILAEAVEKGRRLEPFKIPRTGSSFSEHIINSGQPLLIGDVQKDKFPVAGYNRGDLARSWLGVPLLVRGRTIGAVLVQSTEPNRFSAGQLRLLSQVGNQAAIALENARLFTTVQNYAASLEQRVAERTAALEKERDRVETLLRITSELSASLDLDRVLTRALGLVNDVIGGARADLFLVEPQTTQLIHRATLGHEMHLPPGGQPAGFGRGEGLVGWVINSQESAIASDLETDSRWRQQPLDGAYRSALCVPLLSSEDCLGAMLFLSDVKDAFNIDQLRMVTAAGNQVTSAINNAELYRLIRDQAERLGGMLRANQVEATKSRAILESVADGVLVSDAYGNITLFNATAERILKLNRDEALGHPVRDFMGLYGARAQSLSDTIDKWSADPSTYRPGEYISEQLNLEDNRIVSVLLAPVTTADEYLGTVSIFRDITREVEVDRLKTEFVTTVSHELRTPITPIKGYADILLMGMAGPLLPDQQRAVELIKTNADRLKILVDDLLDISKMESGKVELNLEPLSVADVLEDVSNHLHGRITAQEKPMKVIVDVEPGLPPALGDRQRLTQIITNLADNAFTYTHPEGAVTLSARRDGDTLLIAVKDTGIGIAPEDQIRIFERFYRGEDPLVMASSGTGLGLSIVQRLMEMHGGRIWVESEGIGHGSTFFVRLKLASGNESAA
ncbi:MAG: GAF domain-containing protein [Chloroflexi bacterium]|nr:GAF domain-containing protein [Chloroflexota bacterium]